jgi:hypothetical protein
MRESLFAICLMAVSTSAIAAPPREPIRIPPELTDPATADRIAGMAQALSKAFLDLPIGEVQAAAEGRRATPQERRMTVRDLGRRDNPDFDRNVDQQIAKAGPAIRQGIDAMNRSLPAIDRALTDAAEQLRIVAENLPRPQ